MIQYALKCADGHSFESWFQSAEAFDRLAGSGLLQCAVCGGDQVEKAMMTPRVGARATRSDSPISRSRLSPPNPITSHRRRWCVIGCPLLKYPCL